MEVRIRWLRSLCLFALLFVETSYVCAAVSGDDLHVPYVPYVVVDKNKDEFDYDRLQDEILGYLNRRHSEASTTLYDFLRTSLSPAATPPTAVADVRSISLSSSPSSPSPSSSSYYTVGYPTNPARTAGTAYSVSSVRPPAGATYPVSSVRPGSVAAAYPAYPASIYKSSKKENPLVTAKVRVTTYQPHRYSTPLDNSARGYAPQRDVVSPPVWSQSPPPPLPPARQPPFVRVRDHGFTPIAVTSTTTDSAVYITTAVDLKPTSRLPYPSEMKCSLRSSRYVYDGECVSRKPVVETVCADRCIRYEYKKSKKPYFTDDSKTNALTASETKKQVVALSCSDGDVKKQKVKLYCKDGTIINNIIRIVQNCICTEHSEKVHATKRTQKTASEAKAKMVYSMSHPRIRSRPKLLKDGGGSGGGY